MCCLCHLSWQIDTSFFSIALVTFTLLLPLGLTEILTLHYKKNGQQNEAHCSIQDLLGIIAIFVEKNRDLDICCWWRLYILMSFSNNFQIAIPNFSSGIWITVNVLSAVPWYHWHSSEYSIRCHSRRQSQQFTDNSVFTSTGTSDILSRGSHPANTQECGPRGEFSPVAIVIHLGKYKIPFVAYSETPLQTHRHIFLTNLIFRQALELQEEFLVPLIHFLWWLATFVTSYTN